MRARLLGCPGRSPFTLEAIPTAVARLRHALAVQEAVNRDRLADHRTEPVTRWIPMAYSNHVPIDEARGCLESPGLRARICVSTCTCGTWRHEDV